MKAEMNLAKRTELRLLKEYRDNHSAICHNYELINAHEQYAEEVGGTAVCSVSFGVVTVWANVDSVDGCRLPMPVRMVGTRPIFAVDWNGFEIGVVEK